LPVHECMAWDVVRVLQTSPSRGAPRASSGWQRRSWGSSSARLVGCRVRLVRSLARREAGSPSPRSRAELLNVRGFVPSPGRRCYTSTRSGRSSTRFRRQCIRRVYRCYVVRGLDSISSVRSYLLTVLWHSEEARRVTADCHTSK